MVSTFVPAFSHSPLHGCAELPHTLSAFALREVSETAITLERMRKKFGFIGQQIY